LRAFPNIGGFAFNAFADQYESAFIPAIVTTHYALPSLLYSTVIHKQSDPITSRIKDMGTDLSAS